MSNAIIERLTEERAGLVAFIDQTLAGVEGRDLSDTEVRSISDTRARIEQIDGQLRPLGEFMQVRSSAADLTRFLGGAERRDTIVTESRSWGELFVDSGQFTDYRGRGTSGQFEVETRALPTGLAEIADVLPQKARVDATAMVPTPLLDAIGTITVSQNGIDVVQWVKASGEAAKVAEKAAKPPVEFAPLVVPHTLDTIAAYTQLTRQLIEDAPAVRSAIDTELRKEVLRKLESEAAAALVAQTLPTVSDNTLVKAIRQGVAVVQAAGYNPNAVLVNPADWAELDIEVFTNNHSGPVVGQRFWGLTPIAANSQPVGTATVGDMSAGVQRYARTGVNLYITDSHAETFLSNVFTLLAEARARTIVTRPQALVECTIA